MIRSNHLRKGNIVRHGKSIVTIRGVDDGTVVFWRQDNRWDTCMDSDLLPVLLDPEMLEQIGFEKDDLMMYRHRDIEVVFADSGIIVASNSVCRPHIQYLHQLQNLYFALTGEELCAIFQPA